MQFPSEWIIMVVVLVFSNTSFAQTRVPSDHPATFHVRGKILYLPGAEITFESATLKRTVTTSTDLLYEATLPTGTYTVAV